MRSSSPRHSCRDAAPWSCGKRNSSRFTPQLKILNYTGTTRLRADIAEHDVALTTYGTLRRDVVELKEFEFATIVLDEAHKLSFDRGSPVEKLLREGRKFGLGLLLASQQPEDFSSVAFANTATKIIFQVGDERSTISRQLHRKIKNAHSFGEIYQLITKLPRGCAYVVSENIGRVVRIASFADRMLRWQE